MDCLTRLGALIALAGLVPVHACAEPNSSDEMFAAWRAACPEQAAALSQDPIDGPVADRWRDGDLHSLDCRIAYLEAQAVLDDELDILLDREASPPWTAAYDQAELFMLKYYRWRETGEGLDELDAMARSMEKQWVSFALGQVQFRDEVRHHLILRPDMTLAPEDPGYRFIEIAREDTPQNTPPDN